MHRCKTIFAGMFFLELILLGGESFAAARLESLTVGYSNITATYAPLWLAVEEQVGVKYGLDLKAIYAGRVRPQQLLATGEVPIVIASGTGTLTSHILGVKDQVLVATITSKIGTSLFVKAEIKSVEDLKGKTVATGRPAACFLTHVHIRARSKFGLLPDPTSFAPATYLGRHALDRGIVDSAADVDTHLLCAQSVFTGIGQFDKLGISYPYTAWVLCAKT